MKNDCIARFRCAYEDGTIEAVSYYSHGKEIGRFALRTGTYYGEALAVVQAGSGTEIALTVTDGKQTGTVTVPVTAAAGPGV